MLANLDCILRLLNALSDTASTDHLPFVPFLSHQSSLSLSTLSTGVFPQHHSCFYDDTIVDPLKQINNAPSESHHGPFSHGAHQHHHHFTMFSSESLDGQLGVMTLADHEAMASTVVPKSVKSGLVPFEGWVPS